MSSPLQLSRRQLGFAVAASGLASSVFGQQGQSIPVPGTGQKMDKVCDDFEAEDWKYFANGYKSSDENDKQQRLPAGVAKNNKWYEPIMRGQPDKVERIETPEGGIEGSQGAMYLASIYPGVPGAPSGKVEQDDFCANVSQLMGGKVPVGWQPNVTVRVYVPKQTQWENRSGASFGYRLGLRASHEKKDERGRSEGYLEEYWPGMFFRMEQEVVEVKPVEEPPVEADVPATPNAKPADKKAVVKKPVQKKTVRFIQLSIRADQQGRDIRGPKLMESGWYTLGMTCTANGAVHYFFRAGVEDLRAEDRIASYFPYGYRATSMETFFFNVLAHDTGRTWSTPWVVDDAGFFLANPPRGTTARK